MKKTVVFILLSIALVSCGLFNGKEKKIDKIPIKSGEKWGFIDKNGHYVINPQFLFADYFREGIAWVMSLEGQIGFIDKEGKYIIPAIYKDGSPFSEGLAFVVPEGGYPTCIDKNGETKFILKQAKYVFPFSDGLSLFYVVDKENKRKAGFVDQQGNVVIQPQYEYASSFHEGLAAVEENDKWGFINKEGKIVINPQFDEVGIFKNGLAFFYNGKQYGYIDKEGNYVINPQFDGADFFQDGLAAIKIGELVGFVDEKSALQINPQFEEAGRFNEGLAVIKQNNRFGYINKKGLIEINPQFDEASQFFSDIAIVKSGDRYGIIDRKGKYMVNPQYESILPFEAYIDGSFVTSDYYDAQNFINKFLEKAGETSFDGFTKTTTLQDITSNPLYEEIKVNDMYSTYVHEIFNITDEINIDEIYFLFNNPIYETVNTYSTDWWGDRYSTGTTRKYNFNEIVSGIVYSLDFSGEAEGKGGTIAIALKSKIEEKYKVKMEIQKGVYTILQEDKPSFIIQYSEDSVFFFVGFDKNLLKESFDKFTSDERD